VAIDRASPNTLTRVHQLFQRTNQFNVTTRRYSVSELAALSEDLGCHLYVLRAADRFGDHGLVGTALVRVGEDAWTIDSFLISCRALGCGVETALLASIVADARAADARQVIGEFRATAKNVPAKDFYGRHGFARTSSVDEVEWWGLELSAATVEMPAWIRTEESDDA
jgi:FkbH-like protein